MNPPRPGLVAVLEHTRTLFLDFDGPICAIFAGHPAPLVAARLRDLVRSHGVTVDPAAPGADDPLHVLRLAAAHGDHVLTRRVADTLREAETAATATAQPAPHLDDVIGAARATGRRLAIVSNNSTQAVTAYLHRHGMTSSFTRVVGRYDGMDPALLKPHRHMLDLALTGTGAAPSAAAFVGDTAADIQAARAVSMASIGYANKPGKHADLTRAGASAVVSSMAELGYALANVPVEA